MIKIKHMQAAGNSIREVSRIVKKSKNTVHKYFRMPSSEIDSYHFKSGKISQFEIAREYIIEILTDVERNDMKATTLLREVKKSYPDIIGGERAFRNYLNPLKKEFLALKNRIYTPVTHLVSSCQVQVDLGEEYILLCKGKKRKVHFVAFTFSYSGTMYICFQFKPFNIHDFLRAHLESFQFFGGVALEYVYDQTKLVVISEKFREIDFNKTFDQFRRKYQFVAIVCEGKDPESKGKIERSISYIKQDFLYGKYFPDIDYLRSESVNWLNNVANVRIHGTTKKLVSESFKELKPYLRTDCYTLIDRATRNVDKKGHISYKGNFFSVPFNYQNKKVTINPLKDILYVFDSDIGNQIAYHIIPSCTGITINDKNHYPNKEEKTIILINKVLEVMNDISFIKDLVERLKISQPNIIRGQLQGLLYIYRKYNISLWESIKEELSNLPTIGCKIIEKLLRNSYLRQIQSDNNPSSSVFCPASPIRYAPVRGGAKTTTPGTDSSGCVKDSTSILDRNLEIYDRRIKNVNPN